MRKLQVSGTRPPLQQLYTRFILKRNLLFFSTALQSPSSCKRAWSNHKHVPSCRPTAIPSSVSVCQSLSLSLSFIGTCLSRVWREAALLRSVKSSSCIGDRLPSALACVCVLCFPDILSRCCPLSMPNITTALLRDLSHADVNPHSLTHLWCEAPNLPCPAVERRALMAEVTGLLGASLFRGQAEDAEDESKGSVGVSSCASLRGD